MLKCAKTSIFQFVKSQDYVMQYFVVGLDFIFFIIKLLNYERQTKELILAQFYQSIASILFVNVTFHYRNHECFWKTKKSFDE